MRSRDYDRRGVKALYRNIGAGEKVVARGAVQARLAHGKWWPFIGDGLVMNLPLEGRRRASGFATPEKALDRAEREHLRELQHDLRVTDAADKVRASKQARTGAIEGS